MLKRLSLIPILIVFAVMAALVAGFLVTRKAEKELSGQPQDSSSNSENTQPSSNNPKGIQLRTGLNTGDVPEFTIGFPHSITLVDTFTIPGTQITGHVWSFSINDKDYRFRTHSAVCSFTATTERTIGQDMVGLQVGEKYWPTFTGFEKSFSESSFMGRLNSDCKTVWGRLEGIDPKRLITLFAKGGTEGFETDENGIVDLTKSITPYQVIKD